MKVLLIIYEPISSEARSQEIIELCTKFGATTVVTYDQVYSVSNVTFMRTKLKRNGDRNYLSFYCTARKEIMKKYDLVVLHDNYTSLLIPYIKRKSPNSKIVFDSSELYIDFKPKKIKERLANHFQKSENKYLRRCDAVIAANFQRASIMKEFHGLDRIPIVFDNVHKIEENYNKEEVNQKYGSLFRNSLKTITYAGGLSHRRRTFELIESVKELDGFQLLVLGGTTENELKLFNEYKKNIHNIHYLGFIDRSELKYILENSYISVSIFPMDTLNNINCASGKLYESLFLGIPVLLSTNPPFLDLVEKFSVGVSTNNFKDGILTIEANYEDYQQKVKKYTKTIDLSNRINDLYEKLVDILF